MSVRARSRVPLSLTAAALVVGAIVLVVPLGRADAQVRANRLFNDECLIADFTAFDDVVMTAVATHHSGFGDVYQAICDDEDCWGFSINRFAAVNVLTTGLTAGEYTWYVCAWNGSVRRVVGNLSGGAALFAPELARSASEGGIRVSLDDPRIPEDVRRFAARLGRVPVVRE